MKYKNGKLNKALVVALVFFVIALFDVAANSLIANIGFAGVAQVTPSIMLGPVVFNIISVPVALGAALLFFIIGLLVKRARR